MKKIFSAITILFLVISLTGCGASTESMMDNSFNSATKGESYGPEDSFDENIVEKEDSEITGEKLVYRCIMEIETLNYTETISSIKSSITKYKGIVESESEWDDAYNWYYEDYIKIYGEDSLIA